MRERPPGRSGHALPKRRATTRGQATLQLYAARYTHQPAPAGRRETLRPPTEANTQRPLSSPREGAKTGDLSRRNTSRKQPRALENQPESTLILPSDCPTK